LNQVDRETPNELALHLIVDNYATHKHEKVRDWLARHPRVVMHFTPTGSSWMNLVERFFADLTEDCVREGSFESVRELIEAIDEFLAARNEELKRYVWRAKGEEILRKIERAKAALGRVISI
jgi:transposase